MFAKYKELKSQCERLV